MSMDEERGDFDSPIPEIALKEHGQTPLATTERPYSSQDKAFEESEGHGWVIGDKTSLSEIKKQGSG